MFREAAMMKIPTEPIVLGRDKGEKNALFDMEMTIPQIYID